MIKKLYKWVRQHYLSIINSIAFYPVIIALSFLLFAFLLLQLDQSEVGQNFIKDTKWLQLHDSETARTLAATVAAGILSLAVFSFSMVMILLNQSAVNMSNRVLDSLIGNRYHQVILGFYIGTIVYAFFLLTNIRDIDSYTRIPSITTYTLILLTIADIFLFIYFLHYITQSVKYETIINRLHDSALHSLQDNCQLKEEPTAEPEPLEDEPKDYIYASIPGYLQGFAHKQLLEYCQQQDIKIYFKYPLGTYVIKGAAIATVATKQPLTEEHTKKFNQYIDIHDHQIQVSQSPYLGIKHICEVAIKALSPGVNDPGTAVQSLNSLGNLLSYRISHYQNNNYMDDEGVIRVVTNEHSFIDYFTDSIYPIWDYGKEDRMIQKAMQHILTQLNNLYKEQYNTDVIQKLLNEVNNKNREQ